MAAPSEKSICRLVGERSFARGERYFRHGHVHAARRNGNLLKARCYGSDDNDYRLEVQLKGAKVVGGWCSCPVGAEGLCKHVAAVLLTWRDRPDEFREAPDIESLLADCSKLELIDVIRVLLDTEPDLEDVLESALPIVEEGDTTTADRVRQRVSEALLRTSDRGDSRLAATAIDAQRAQAERRLSRGEVSVATMIGRGTLAAVIADYDMEADVTGQVARAVNDTVEFLERCFEKLPEDEPQRQELLHQLLSLLWFDVSHAGTGLAESAPETIARHASAREKRSIVAWSRELASSLPRGAASDAWRRECWGALILDIVGHDVPEEDYVELCRDLGVSTSRAPARVEHPASRRERASEQRNGRKRRKT